MAIEGNPDKKSSTNEGDQGPAAPGDGLDENTASPSSDDDDSDEDWDGAAEDKDPMPLLSYSRLFGSLPRRGMSQTTDNGNTSNTTNRTFAATSTCSVLGQVVLSQQDPTGAAAASSPESIANAEQRATSTPGRQSASQTPFVVQSGDPLLSQQPHWVLAMGYANGSIELVDARTGVSVTPSEQLRLRDANHQPPEAVVDLSMDSSGTFLAAVDSGRMVVIWEIQYTILQHQQATDNSSSNTNRQQPMSEMSPGTPQPVPSSSQQQQTPSTPAEAGVFSSFMSAFSLSTPNQNTSSTARLQSQAASTSAAATSGNGVMVQRLSTSSIQLSRISYPRSFGVPTCIAIDPSYKRRREKAVLTGFLDGRLVLTKRGFVFQRRTDAIIYQGTYNQDDNNHRGIEAIEWRGSLAAWADASGIRIFDTESLTRIAHIDRPTGARPSLYPTLKSLRPSLCFETNSFLLVAWGDCLMGLNIIDHSRQPQTIEARGSNESDPSATDASPPPQQQQQQQPVVRRRTVDCAMAWELDCCASGVVPLDSDHVMILGVVPPVDDDDEDEVGDPQCNDLELQIIAKEDGSILFSNILPLLRDAPSPQQSLPPNDQVSPASAVLESASDYTLLSSFALPRMDDSFEAAAQESQVVEEFDVQVSLFSPTSQAPQKFVDPHKKWNLKGALMGEEKEVVLTMDENLDAGEQHLSIVNNDHQRADDDTGSVDSDDYGFIFRPMPTQPDQAPPENTGGSPPLMVIASSSDVVLARMRDVDDAISHALSLGKSALALRRALHQKRRVRKFQLNDLINAYFASLLRIPGTGVDGDGQQTKPLSIRRLKLAARAMPVLFGGDIQLWERWIAEVQKIPGALFVLSDHIPVRDPRLPKELYGKVLETMLKELEQMNGLAEEEGIDDTSEKVVRAEQKFSDTMIGWGTTDFLREYAKLCRLDDEANDIENRFSRRFTQSSVGYLSFPVPSEETELTQGGPRIRSDGYHEAKEALFDIDEVASGVSRTALVVSDSSNSGTIADATIGKNTLAALDAMGKLNMMRGRYDSALRCFLFIGALHASRPSADDVNLLSGFEEAAVDFSDSVGDRDFDKPWEPDNGAPYTYVLDLIDSHNLHQCLLDDQFLSVTSSESKKFVPIFALLQLVGFNGLGKFLIEHCVPPQAKQKKSRQEEHSSDDIEERGGTIQIDLISEQFKKSPKLLHWYLHLVFTHKPEVYVKFPNTAYPPQAVTDLHRLHFNLHVEYAGQERDSAWFCSQYEAYKVGNLSTRLLHFLKTALPLGGIRVQDAKKTLVEEREKEEAEFPPTFALELAFIIELYGEETEAEAEEVLDLYVKGAQSLVLAVSFAQRTTAYSASLWKKLIQHCLEHESGLLFGELLEAAALSGSDLAKLVTQIPPGMAIEGLRPRLVAAVADYRLKLKMHETASEGATQEMISILQELSHRSRRGSRYQLPPTGLPDPFIGMGMEESKEETKDDGDGTAPQKVLLSTLRTSERKDRHNQCLAPPMR